MRLFTGIGLIAVVSTAVAACSAAPDASPWVDGGVEKAPSAVSAGLTTVVGARGNVEYYEAPKATADGSSHTNVRRRTDERGSIVAATPTPGTGWNASELQEMYGIPSLGGPSPTIAILDFFDDPNAEADMNVYRAQWGLPACTTAGNCFRKVNESGAASPLPTKIALPDSGVLAMETALDLEMVSAACPTCKILLVELSSTSTSENVPGWNTAIALGATFISNSFGAGEAAANDSSPALSHAGVSFFASAGDGGFGVGWPSSSAHVTSVGGTVLSKLLGAPWWSQTTWPDTGGGCSTKISKPSWQPDTWCGSFRTVNDVSAVAASVEIFDSYAAGGWTEVGGTSVSAPLVAGIYAVNGWNGVAPSFSYGHLTSFTDVTTGSDGTCASAASASLCNAAVGYDGPTGNGTPIGASPYADTLSVTPGPINVAAGSVTTAQVTASGRWVINSSNPVAYSLSGAPSWLNATLTRAGNNSVLSFAPALGTPPQSTQFQLVANAWNITHQVLVTVNVTAPDTLFITPNVITVSAGMGASAQIVAGPWSTNPSAPVSFAITGGSTVQPAMPSLFTSGAVTYFDFTSLGTTTPQTLTYTISGTAGNVTNVTSVTVHVTSCIPQTAAVACNGSICGAGQDICGNTVQCGTCAAGLSCSYGQCYTCAPKICRPGQFWDPEVCSCMGCMCGTIVVGNKTICAACR